VIVVHRWCTPALGQPNKLVTPMPGPGLEPGRGCPQEILRGLSPPETGIRQREADPGSPVKTRGIVGSMVQWVVQSRSRHDPPTMPRLSLATSLRSLPITLVYETPNLIAGQRFPAGQREADPVPGSSTIII
jgi:hypothetical protein